MKRCIFLGSGYRNKISGSGSYANLPSRQIVPIRQGRPPTRVPVRQALVRHGSLQEGFPSGIVIYEGRIPDKHGSRQTGFPSGMVPEKKVGSVRHGFPSGRVLSSMILARQAPVRQCPRQT